MKTVFVCSTIWDLIDVRSEVRDFLQRNGFQPLMSEHEEINRLAVSERNAFKPIYQMHKWFARRGSCVFRAILLGALKPLPVDKNGNR